MKTTLSIAMLAVIFSSCATKTETGALAGASLGAVAGSLIGGSKGAVVGGALGTIAGASIGAGLDEEDRRTMSRRSPQTVARMDRREPITVDDVIHLSEGGVSPDTIIHYIRETNTVYSLSQAQIRKMQEMDVNQRVINYMVNAG